MMATTVLIAVPDLLFRSRLRDAARHVGAETTAASNSADVLSRAIASRPDVIVLDLGDDRLEPFELIRMLKDEPSLAATRIVGFFSHVRIDIRDAARAAGCDVILPRSVAVSALAGIVKEADGRHDPGEA